MDKRRRKRKKKITEKPADTGKRYEYGGIATVAFSAVSLCGLAGLNVGFIGFYFARFLRYFFGVGSWFFALLLLLVGIQLIVKHHGLRISKRFLGVAVFYTMLLAVYHHLAIPVGEEILPHSLPEGGGLLGGGVLFVVRKLFGVDGGLVVLIAGGVGSVLLATTWSLASGVQKTEKHAQEGIALAQNAMESTYDKVKELRAARAKKESFYNQEADERFDGAAPAPAAVPAKPAPVMTPPVAPAAEQPVFTDIAAPEPVEIPVQSTPESPMPEPIPFEEPVYEPVFEPEPEPEYASEPELPMPPSFTIEYSEETHQPAEVYAPEESDDIPEPPAPVMPAPQPAPRPQPAPVPTSQQAAAPQDTQAVAPAVPPEPVYQIPKVEEILDKHPHVRNAALEQEIADKAQALSRTLENFKVKATILNACHGPAITRYELEPAPGVKVSKITNLADDLALALAAFSVRIEPIPGKSAIGIEVPNRELEGVVLRDVLEDPAFNSAKSKLTVGLGKDVSGKAIFADLAKMPHLLIAGATGSGKSVCVNTLITSILFKASPEEVKFILIDPKMVELSNYNGIPHLMVPVVTDMRKAASVLNWAVQEMEKRYGKFAEHGVRNIEGFNNKLPDDKMPSIVLIIDELADLMMVAPHDVEDAICRIAQKARAAGIHLVLATQRPSVNVITGIIKANIPSRISFAVSSQVDSRTILDMSGAEKLLGKGDMLFYPVGSSKPQRVQGAFISDEEVDRLLEFIRGQGQEVEPNEEIINFTEQAAQEAEDKEGGKGRGNSDGPAMDEYLPKAVELIMQTGQASTSSIQRRFRIGYTRAARLIDTMEELGIVGPNIGSKPREILMTEAEARETVDSVM